MEKKLKSFESEELIREAFDVIDTDAEGFITLSKLRHVVTDLGLNLNDDELNEMISEADPSGDGRVSYKGNYIPIYSKTCLKCPLKKDTKNSE